MEPVICLASASPRRRELLAQIGVPHHAVAAAIDESRRTGETARAYVARLARAKCTAIHAQPALSRALPVLAADTVVSVDEDLLGKPVDRAEALAMLRRLSGRQHVVLTAVCLQTATASFERVAVTTVKFAPIREPDLERYLDSREPYDKAGAYAVQGLAAVFIDELHGSYSNVVGLPLAETAAVLAAAGLPFWCGCADES
ncbi:MAG: Maf family protein [Steroidobacteraceae bacterium]